MNGAEAGQIVARQFGGARGAGVRRKEGHEFLHRRVEPGPPPDCQVEPFDAERHEGQPVKTRQRTKTEAGLGLAVMQGDGQFFLGTARSAAAATDWVSCSGPDIP